MYAKCFFLFSLCRWHCHLCVVCTVCSSSCWLRLALPSFHIVSSAKVSTLLSTFGLSSLLILTFLSPIWLTFCLHLFRCSQQQWPSSRLVRPRCQVSFCILPAVHSILQLSSLRSSGGKSAAREGERERGEEKGRNRIIVHPVTDWSGSHSRHTNNSRQLVTSH